MRDEVNETDATTLSYDRIFKELSKLEKDYRYQDTLLKMKSEDYEKCSNKNRILKEHLDHSFIEIENLRKQIQELESKNNEIIASNIQEKELCDQVVQKLTGKIATMNAEHKSAIDNCHALVEQTKKEMTENYKQQLEEVHNEYKEDILRLQHQIEHEMNHSNQLKSKLDFTLEDNLLLQDKLRQLQQQYVPIETCKTQLRVLTVTNEKLKAQLLHLRNESQSLAAENVHFKKHNIRLNILVNSLNEQKKQAEIEIGEKQILLRTMQSQLNETIAKYNHLIEECNKLTNEKQILQETIAKHDKDFCNVDSHHNVLEQNQILQELVKEMRREKLNGTGDQENHLGVTDERLKRLEHLIYELKNLLVSNCVP